jgi:predicted nucleic-acid-binding Zn-ribbon protein
MEDVGDLPQHDFDPDHRCPKCLATDPDIEYHEQLEDPTMDYLGMTELVQYEHLRLTCQRCGYRWATDVADRSRP